jgi:hypothetical protein
MPGLRLVASMGRNANMPTISEFSAENAKIEDWLAERSQSELSGDFARVRKQPNSVGLRRFRTQHREELLQCKPTPRRR